MRRVACVAALLLGGCGSSPTTPATPSPSALPQAAIALSVDVAPLGPSPDPSGPFEAHWNVVMRETAGVGGNVQFVNAMVRDASSGATARPTGGISYGTTELLARLGTTRIPGNGSVTLPETLTYSLASGGRQASLTVTMRFVDDSGHFVTATTQTVIQ
jgi:hypothetical protein